MNSTSADLVEQVRRQLQEAGYSVVRPIAEEPSLLLVSQENRPLFSVKVFPGALRLNTAYRLGSQAQADRGRVLEAINEFNRTGIGVWGCLNRCGELAIESWLYSPPEPTVFADFLRRVWFRELGRLVHEPGIRMLDLQPADAIATTHNQRR